MLAIHCRFFYDAFILEWIHEHQTVSKENTVLLWVVRRTRDVGVFPHDALHEQVLCH